MTTKAEMELHIQSVVSPALHSLGAIHELLGNTDEITAQGIARRGASAKSLPAHPLPCAVCDGFQG